MSSVDKLNKIKNKLKNKKPTIGTWVQIANSTTCEILSSSNSFDWICVDLEHSSISLETCEALIRNIDQAGLIPFVRVTSNDNNLIKRVMDSGALGIVVPMINDLQSIINARNAMHLPPRGTRGVGLARVQEWGNSFDIYREQIDPNTLLIAQIEHIKAVENINEIFSSGLIDAYFIGPYDLSASLGCPGDFNNKNFISALERIKKSSLKHNIASGIHLVEPDQEKLKKIIKEEYIFIAYSMDTVMLREAAKINL